MPVPLIAAVQHIVVNDPSRWIVSGGLEDFAGHGWPIVQIETEHGYLALLLARGSWTILGDPASLPVLSECLDPLVPADLHNIDKFEDYLWHVVFLQKHGKGAFMDNDFRRRKGSRIRAKLWTDGSEVQRQELRALCHDPVMTRSGDNLTVRLNVIASQGQVERWTFHLQVGKTLQLKGTEVRKIRKEGTFFYPLV